MTDGQAFHAREDTAERYLLGEMTEADREQYEEHFFSCADCAEDVRTTAAFLDDVKRQVAPTAATRPARLAAVEPIRPRPARSLVSFFWPLPTWAEPEPDARLPFGVAGPVAQLVRAADS